ncbi:hypothetical protein V5799_028989, partial [Amblyomma americanum]
ITSLDVADIARAVARGTVSSATCPSFPRLWGEGDRGDVVQRNHPRSALPAACNHEGTPRFHAARLDGFAPIPRGVLTAVGLYYRRLLATLVGAPQLLFLSSNARPTSETSINDIR